MAGKVYGLKDLDVLAGMEPDLEQRTSPYQHAHARSSGERAIAAFFDEAGIRYEYERGVLVLDQGKPKIWHPDFHLPEFAVHIEYYGLADDPTYRLGMERKERVYREMGMDVIPVYPWTFGTDWKGYITERIREIHEARGAALEDKLSYRRPYSGPVRAASPRLYRT